MGIEPVPIKIYGDPNSDKQFKKTVPLPFFHRVLCRKNQTLRAIRRKICYASTETSM